MATYTFATARDVVASRTFLADTTKLGYEMNAAIQWAYNRIYVSAKGPDMIEAFADEETLAAITRELSLATATGATTLVGVKKLWLKLPADTVFSEMIPVDANDPRFAVGDNLVSTDTTTVALGHPVYYHLMNNQTVRFSSPLPINAIVRTDYFKFVTLGALTGIDDLVHQCIIDKATGLVFLNLTDDRWAVWDGLAERNLKTAIHAINRKVQGPLTTLPYRVRRTRWL